MVTTSNDESYPVGSRAYVAGYPSGEPDIPVRVVGTGEGGTVRVRFSAHDHGRHIPRGVTVDVDEFYLLPESMGNA